MMHPASHSVRLVIARAKAWQVKAIMDAAGGCD